VSPRGRVELALEERNTPGAPTYAVSAKDTVESASGTVYVKKDARPGASVSTRGKPTGITRTTPSSDTIIHTLASPTDCTPTVKVHDVAPRTLPRTHARATAASVG